jgi:hypothetical protein
MIPNIKWLSPPENIKNLSIMAIDQKKMWFFREYGHQNQILCVRENMSKQCKPILEAKLQRLKTICHWDHEPTKKQ